MKQITLSENNLKTTLLSTELLYVLLIRTIILIIQIMVSTPNNFQFRRFLHIYVITHTVGIDHSSL